MLIWDTTVGSVLLKSRRYVWDQILHNIWNFVILNLLTSQKPSRVYAGYNQEYLGSINCIFIVIYSAECFVRVRSGQSMDHSVVKDRLNVHSVGECELECLRSRYFTCRVFSFRYSCAYISFKNLTALNIKFMVLWFVTTCSALGKVPRYMVAHVIRLVLTHEIPFNKPSRFQCMNVCEYYQVFCRSKSNIY